MDRKRVTEEEMLGVLRETMSPGEFADAIGGILDGKKNAYRDELVLTDKKVEQLILQCGPCVGEGEYDSITVVLKRLVFRSMLEELLDLRMMRRRLCILCKKTGGK